MDIDTLLRDEIKTELNKLKGIEIGTPEHKAAVEDLTKLMDRAIDIEKLDIQEKENSEKRKDAAAAAKFEQELKTQQIQEERIDRFARHAISVAGIAIPAVLTVWGAIKSWRFEENGTITSGPGRSFMGRLIPKR